MSTGPLAHVGAPLLCSVPSHLRNVCAGHKGLAGAGDDNPLLRRDQIRSCPALRSAQRAFRCSVRSGLEGRFIVMRPIRPLTSKIRFFNSMVILVSTEGRVYLCAFAQVVPKNPYFLRPTPNRVKSLKFKNYAHDFTCISARGRRHVAKLLSPLCGMTTSSVKQIRLRFAFVTKTQSLVHY